MITTILKRYNRFGDAVINKIEYRIDKNHKKIVTLYLHCFDAHKNFDLVNIKIIFDDVSSFQFVEPSKHCSTVIDEALITERSGGVLFDFFPIQDNILIENKNSGLKIISKDFKIQERVLFDLYQRQVKRLSRMIRNRFYWWELFR